jgi:hypothetical protein
MAMHRWQSIKRRCPFSKSRYKQAFPGFAIAYAVEIGTVGAGAEMYQHGGVAHVLLPVQGHMSQ